MNVTVKLYPLRAEVGLLRLPAYVEAVTASQAETLSYCSTWIALLLLQTLFGWKSVVKHLKSQ